MKEDVDLSTLPDEVVFEKLSTEHAAIKIAIHDLEISRPSIFFSLVTFGFSSGLLIVAIALLVFSYFKNPSPPELPIGAAFLVVVFAFASYVTFRRVVVDHESRKVHKAVSARAKYLESVARGLLTQPPNSVNAEGSNAG
jgi:hypothetical protein